jgi:hypothetical protein
MIVSPRLLGTVRLDISTISLTSPSASPSDRIAAPLSDRYVVSQITKAELHTFVIPKSSISRDPPLPSTRGMISRTVNHLHRSLHLIGIDGALGSKVSTEPTHIHPICPSWTNRPPSQ